MLSQRVVLAVSRILPFLHLRRISHLDAKAILAAADYALDDDARVLLFPEVQPPPSVPPLPALPEWPFRPEEYTDAAATPIPARIKRREICITSFQADAGPVISRII